MHYTAETLRSQRRRRMHKIASCAALVFNKQKIKFQIFFIKLIIHFKACLKLFFLFQLGFFFQANLDISVSSC